MPKQQQQQATSSPSPVKAPEIVEHMHMLTYLARPEHDQTDLKVVNKSLAHYKHHKAQPPRKNDDLIFGDAFHKLILEPPRFQSSYFCGPREKIDRRTKAGKIAWEKCVEEAGKRDILKFEQCDELEAMAAAVHEHELIQSHGLLQGQKEVSVFWADPETGILLKLRLDVLNLKRRFFVDLKSARDANPNGQFRTDACRFGYHVQMSFYQAACNLIWPGETPFRAFIIASEKSAPYIPVVCEYDKESLAVGAKIWQSAMAKLANAIASDKYPGYSNGLVELTLPPWGRGEGASQTQTQENDDDVDQFEY